MITAVVREITANEKDQETPSINKVGEFGKKDSGFQFRSVTFVEYLSAKSTMTHAIDM
jgi:hypothetical protein